MMMPTLYIQKIAELPQDFDSDNYLKQQATEKRTLPRRLSPFAKQLIAGALWFNQTAQATHLTIMTQYGCSHALDKMVKDLWIHQSAPMPIDFINSQAHIAGFYLSQLYDHLPPPSLNIFQTDGWENLMWRLAYQPSNQKINHLCCHIETNDSPTGAINRWILFSNQATTNEAQTMLENISYQAKVLNHSDSKLQTVAHDQDFFEYLQTQVDQKNMLQTQWHKNNWHITLKNS